jgi:hypothetical protein
MARVKTDWVFSPLLEKLAVIQEGSDKTQRSDGA